MGSYFQDNPPTAEELAEWRKDLAAAWPYTEDDPEPLYFDWIPDPARSDATDAMYLLKASGNWTEADERIAFVPANRRPGRWRSWRRNTMPVSNAGWKAQSLCKAFSRQ